MKKNNKNKQIIGKKNAEIFAISVLAFMLVQWLVFYLIMNLNSILLAFKHFDGYEQKFYDAAHLFDNFKRFFREVFADREVGTYVRNGMLYHLMGLLALPLSLIFAFIIYKKLPASGFFKIILFLPSILSAMVVALFFKFAISDGFRNVWEFVLKKPRDEFPAPLMNNDYSLLVLLAYSFFFALPGSLLINLGTMSKTPEELIEYGKLEGLSLWQEFVYLTIPLMFPVLEIYCLTIFSGFFTAQGPLFAIFGTGNNVYVPQNAKSFGYYMLSSVLSGTGGADPQYIYGYNSAANLTIGLISVPIIWGTKKLFDKIDPGAEF